mmetsp:Transcript_15045/g.25875  ORF Transcript_15045/g.25875 Transcript_15045/m.25875 type:complete len:148 (+) Transcript_15045:25-468(+)
MSELSDKQKAKFLKAFKKVDSNDDGSIDRHELAKLLKHLGYKVGKKELSRMMKSADGDSNGKIEYSEFEKLISDINLYQEEDLQDTFKKFDIDGDGFVVASELKEALKTFYGTEITDKEADEMVEEADTTGDKKLTYVEFKAVLLAD